MIWICNVANSSPAHSHALPPMSTMFSHLLHHTSLCNIIVQHTNKLPQCRYSRSHPNLVPVNSSSPNTRFTQNCKVYLPVTPKYTQVCPSVPRDTSIYPIVSARYITGTVHTEHPSPGPKFTPCARESMTPPTLRWRSHLAHISTNRSLHHMAIIQSSTRL